MVNTKDRVGSVAEGGVLFVVSAASGAGKTSLVKQVVSRWGAKLGIERLITYTSRAPRSGEQDGVDYHFLSSHEFERRIEDGFFLEWSTAYGTYYGAARSLVDAVTAGKSFLVILDRVGAEHVQRYCREQAPRMRVRFILILPPSLDELRTRLMQRATEEDAAIAQRLALAKQELEQERLYPLYQHQIVNEKLEQATDELVGIICAHLGRSKG